MTKFKCGDVVHDGFHYGVVVKSNCAHDPRAPWVWWLGWRTGNGSGTFGWTPVTNCRLIEGERADKVRLTYMKLLTAGKVTPDL